MSASCLGVASRVKLAANSTSRKHDTLNRETAGRHSPFRHAQDTCTCQLRSGRGAACAASEKAASREATDTAREQQEAPRKDLVRSLPPVRPAAPPPQAVAVEHSSSFLYRQRQQEIGRSLDDDYFGKPSASKPERSWHEEQQEVNAAAANGLSNAAKATANVGKAVLSIGLPVGGWAVRQGFKAAQGALRTSSTKSGGRRRSNQKEGE